MAFKSLQANKFLINKYKKQDRWNQDETIWSIFEI